MAIDITKLDKSGIQGWGATLANNMKVELKRVAGLSANELGNADLSVLKNQIARFEELQARAKELNMNIYGTRGL